MTSQRWTEMMTKRGHGSPDDALNYLVRNYVLSPANLTSPLFSNSRIDAFSGDSFDIYTGSAPLRSLPTPTSRTSSFYFQRSETSFCALHTLGSITKPVPYDSYCRASLRLPLASTSNATITPHYLQGKPHPTLKCLIKETSNLMCRFLPQTLTAIRDMRQASYLPG